MGKHEKQKFDNKWESEIKSYRAKTKRAASQIQIIDRAEEKQKLEKETKRETFLEIYEHKENMLPNCKHIA